MTSSSSKPNFNLTALNRHQALDTILDSSELCLPLLFQDQLKLMETYRTPLILTKGLFCKDKDNDNDTQLQSRRRTRSEAVVPKAKTKNDFKPELQAIKQICENEFIEPLFDDIQPKSAQRFRSKSEVLPLSLEYKKLAKQFGFDLVPTEIASQIVDPFGDLPKRGSNFSYQQSVEIVDEDPENTDGESIQENLLDNSEDSSTNPPTRPSLELNYCFEDDEDQLDTVFWSELEANNPTTSNEPGNNQVRYSKLGFQFNPTTNKQQQLPINETKRLVMAASLKQLVAILTNQLDFTLMSDFFLTYRLFITKFELLSLLLARYKWSLIHDKQIHHIVRVRMFVVLRHWLINYFQTDFQFDFELRTKLAFGLIELQKLDTVGAKELRILNEIKSIMLRLTPSSTSYYLVVTPLDEANQFWGTDFNNSNDSCNQSSSKISLDMAFEPVCGSTNVQESFLERNSSFNLKMSTDNSLHSSCNALPSLLNTNTDLSANNSQSSTELPGINQSRSLELRLQNSLPNKSSFSKLSFKRNNGWNPLKGWFNKPNDPTLSSLHESDELPVRSEININNKVRKFGSLNKLLQPKNSLTMSNNKTNLMFSNNRVETKLISQSLLNPASTPLSRYQVMGPIDHLPLSQHINTSQSNNHLIKNKLQLHKLHLNYKFKNTNGHFILDHSSESIAQQFALIEAQLLVEIKWENLLEKFFKPKVADPNPTSSNESAGIDNLVARFNKVCAFIIEIVSNEKSVEVQVQLLEKFIKVAYKSYLYNNFATLTQILLALQSSQLSQLSLSWSLVCTEMHTSLAFLVDFTNPFHNWKKLRSTMLELCDRFGEVNDLLINKPNNTTNLINNLNTTNRFAKEDSTFKFKTGFSFLTKSNSNNENLNSNQPNSLGCIPFLGLYLSDLLHLTELPNILKPEKNSTQSTPKSRPCSTPIMPTTPIDIHSIPTSPNPQLTNESIIQSFPTPPKLQPKIFNLTNLKLNHEKVVNFHKFRQISIILKRFLTFKRLANFTLNNFSVNQHLLALCTEL